MGKFAPSSALAIAAVLICFPAGAEEIKRLSTDELLKPSPDNAAAQGIKIIGYACKDVLFLSPMSAAANLVGDVVTEGRGEFSKFVVGVIADKAAAALCDAIVVKPPKPELDMGKSLDPGSPSIYQRITGAKAPERLPCLPDQFYNPIGHVCVGLQVTPVCSPGQHDDSRKCADVSSLPGPRCANYERYDIIADKCVMNVPPNCPGSEFFNAMESRCVSLSRH
jgi:hypothetical protein